MHIVSSLCLKRFLFRQGRAVLNSRLPKAGHAAQKVMDMWVWNHGHCTAHVLGVVVLLLIGIACVT